MKLMKLEKEDQDSRKRKIRHGVQQIPAVDAVLQFAKPSVNAAAFVCQPDGLILYHTLDAEIVEITARKEKYATPMDAMLDLLYATGIECGRESDGDGLKGKIVDLTEPSYASPINEVYPELQVNEGTVLFDYKDILSFVVNKYEGNRW